MVIENNNITQNCIYENSAITLLALNIRSIRLHFDELALFLDLNNCEYDVIILSETWLANDFKFLLIDYHILNSIGRFNKSDGITYID